MKRKSPLNELRDQIRRWAKVAYGKGIRLADEQAEYVWQHLFEKMKPPVRKLWDKAWIKEIANSTWAALLDEEERDLFGMGMDAIQDEFHLVDPATGEVIARNVRLGDFGLIEMEISSERKRANVKRATMQLQRWELACSYVRPLLETNPKWTWRDAVEDMKKRGVLPSI